MNRREIAAAVAVGLYIVFFAMEPPAILRGVLDNIVGLGALFLAAAYVTIYISKVVGGLLLLAVVLSASRGGREGLTTQAWSADRKYVKGDMMTVGGKTYVALFNNDNNSSTSPQFATYWKESVTVTPGAPWNANATYRPMDTMTSGGKTYVAKLENNNMPPSNPQFSTYWVEQPTAGSTTPPATTPTAGTSTTTPAATPATTTVPAPTNTSSVASCNLENFTTQRRSLPQEYASF